MVTERLWSHDNVPEILWYMDPDKVAYTFATVLEHESETDGDLIDSVYDLFDPDTCPDWYVPYLAAAIGLRLYADDDIAVQRSQIRSAVAWYKEKGKIESFELLFHTMSISTEIYPLWINEDGSVERYPVDSSWKPHARIDLYMKEYPEWRRYFPEKLQYVLTRMEDVRPTHVLLRGIFLAWEFNPDPFPFDDVEDVLEGRVLGLLNEYWESAYWHYCGIWHYPKAQEGKLHNGGGYTWELTPVLEYTSTVPSTPSVGDRYIVAPGSPSPWDANISDFATWNGSSWDFTEPPSIYSAVWATHGNVDEAAWHWYSFNAGSWGVGGQLYDLPYSAPGPFFRECSGPLDGVIGGGPGDTLLNSAVSGGFSDTFEECFLHDGLLNQRIGTYFHNCREIFDQLSIVQHPSTP